MIGLPSAPGAYALQIHLARPHEQEIGKLGRFWFPAAGFGCSDCRNGCPAHLLRFSEFDQAAVSERLEQITHAIATLQQIGECRVFRAIWQLGQSHLDDLPPPR